MNLFVFHQQVDFRLTNCTMVQAVESRLTFSGTFARLFDWENVSVEFTLLDRPTSGTAQKRHSVFRINIPNGYSAYTYLNQYSLEPGAVVSAEVIALIQTWKQSGSLFPCSAFESVGHPVSKTGDGTQPQ